MPQSCCYLVAVTRGLRSDALAHTVGVGNAPLRLVEDGELQAVVCDVELDEFGEEPLRRHLEDLSWVEETARAHHHAVSEVSDVGTVVPMRFATIYASDGRVRQQLETLRPQLVAALDRVEGCSEWSIKVYAAAADPEPVETTSESGSSYLMRKRDAAHQRTARERSDAETLSELHRTLSSLSVASRTLMLQDPRLTQRQEPMRMNAAYLVADAARHGFMESAEAALGKQSGLWVEVGGPWPPYSFATLDAP